MASADVQLLNVRSFSVEQDIPGLVALHTAVEAADLDGVVVSEQALREQLGLAGHDPKHDRWLVDSPDDPSSIIASASIRLKPGARTADANITVHPAWRQREIEGLLLPRLIERARQHNADSIQVFTSTRNQAASNFLQENGFTVQGAYTELRLQADIHLPPVIWPFGYTMRPFTEVQKVSTLTEAMNLSYIPLWGHREVSEDEMASWLPDFIQEGIFLVFSEKGRVVGISRTEPSPERTLKNGQSTGYIDAPGVVPQHRRLDLYRALVLTGIRWLRDQGQVLIEMESWGDKLEVLKMYRELGFKDIRQLVCYQLNLATGDGVS